MYAARRGEQFNRENLLLDERVYCSSMRVKEIVIEGANHPGHRPDRPGHRPDDFTPWEPVMNDGSFEQFINCLLYTSITFIMMLGFSILLRAFGLPAWLAGLGGAIWAFSSYFFILIAAGHIWKFITLAYIPPTIAGIVLAYRKKYLLGAIVTALFIALQIQSNHVQMSYYFLFVILFMVGAFFEEAWRKKELPHFFKASAISVSYTHLQINLYTQIHIFSHYHH